VTRSQQLNILSNVVRYLIPSMEENISVNVRIPTMSRMSPIKRTETAKVTGVKWIRHTLRNWVGTRCLIKPKKPGDSCAPLLTPCTDVTDTACSNSVPGGEWTCRCTGDLVTNTDDDKITRCVPKPELPSDSCHPDRNPCSFVQGTSCYPKNETAGYYCKCEGVNFVTDWLENHRTKL
jgi:hypothetical protein